MMDREESINLWKLGKVKWNQRITENPTESVDFSNVDFAKHTQENVISFKGFIFPEGRVSFKGAKFINKKFVSFKGAKFNCRDEVLFNDVMFNCDDHISFDNAEFKGAGSVSFINTKFFSQGGVSFLHTEFLVMGGVSFVNAEFRGKGGVSFSCTKFGVKKNSVNFNYAKFFGSGRISFNGTVFSGKGDVSFNHSTFNDDVRVSFEKAEFDMNCNMENAVFCDSIKKLSFRYSSFNKNFRLPSLKLGCVLDLRNIKFTNQIMLHDIICTLQTETRRRGIITFKVASDIEDVSKLRRLKEIAEANRNHEGALVFHADEMRAKRWHVFGKMASSLDLVFDKISNYGQSIGIPLTTLILLNFCFTILYYLTAYINTPICMVRRWDMIFQAVDVTIFNSLPFIPVARTIGVAGKMALFQDLIPFWFGVVSTAQGFISIILLFLIGLGIRNRFRI